VYRPNFHQVIEVAIRKNSSLANLTMQNATTSFEKQVALYNLGA
jgi:hypothetical protein